MMLSRLAAPLQDHSASSPVLTFGKIRRMGVEVCTLSGGPGSLQHGAGHLAGKELHRESPSIFNNLAHNTVMCWYEPRATHTADFIPDSSVPAARQACSF